MCGSTSLELVDNNKLIKFIPGRETDGYINSSFAVYACKKCGHLEFFSARPIQNKAIKELEDVVKQMEKDLAKKKKEKANKMIIHNLEQNIADMKRNIKELKDQIA